MAFRTGSYAKVWEIKPNANYTDVRLSTSKKRKDGNGYDTDFSGFVRLIGDAHTKAATIQEGSRIKIGDISATQTWNKEKQKQYTNFQMYSFESSDSALPERVTYTKIQRSRECPTLLKRNCHSRKPRIVVAVLMPPLRKKWGSEMSKTVKCRYAHCKHPGEEMNKEDAIKAGNAYYHKDCYEEKIQINEIVSFYTSNLRQESYHGATPQDNQQLIFDRKYTTDFLMYALRYTRKLNNIPLKHL